MLDHIEGPRESPARGQVFPLETLEGTSPAPRTDGVDRGTVILKAGHHFGERREDMGWLDRSLGLRRELRLEEGPDELG